MMKTISNYLLSLLCLLMASQAYAQSCYQQSPNLVDGDDSYYNIENTIPFPAAAQAQFTNLLNQITGQWQGNISTIECYGPDNAAYTKSKSGNIKTDHLLSSNGSITLNNEVAFDESMTTLNSNFLLPANLFNLKIIDDTHAQIAQKIRRGTTTGASRLVEIIFDFHLHNPNNLTVTQSIYINGVYTYTETWSLYR